MNKEWKLKFLNKLVWTFYFWCNAIKYLENYNQPINASLKFRSANYTMFISEMGYFTVSVLDLKGKI